MRRASAGAPTNLSFRLAACLGRRLGKRQRVSLDLQPKPVEMGREEAYGPQVHMEGSRQIRVGTLCPQRGVGAEAGAPLLLQGLPWDPPPTSCCNSCFSDSPSCKSTCAALTPTLSVRSSWQPIALYLLPPLGLLCRQYSPKPQVLREMV